MKVSLYENWYQGQQLSKSKHCLISASEGLLLKEKNISQIALSENHAIALSHSGIAFSWGLGKYGELGQERTIYTPFPLQINSENLYSKVFCSNYVTCFLDFECHFSYFGVIIRNIEMINIAPNPYTGNHGPNKTPLLLNGCLQITISKNTSYNQPIKAYTQKVK